MEEQKVRVRDRGIPYEETVPLSEALQKFNGRTDYVAYLCEITGIKQIKQSGTYGFRTRDLNKLLKLAEDPVKLLLKESKRRNKNG